MGPGGATGALVGVSDSSATYTYYASGRMHIKTLLVADGSTPVGTIFEYDDTATHNVGASNEYGHLIKQTNPDGLVITRDDALDQLARQRMSTSPWGQWIF